MLDAWLKLREDTSPALFPTRSGRRLSRREAAPIIQHIAAQANAHLSGEEKIEVSPHVLRHTFLRKLAETKGAQYAKEASGHQSDRYICAMSGPTGRHWRRRWMRWSNERIFAVLCSQHTKRISEKGDSSTRGTWRNRARGHRLTFGLG